MREIEPSVTRDLEDVASRREARLVDPDTRFKTRDSITRKMEQARSYNPDISEKRLKRRVFDALRYTMVCRREDYSETVKDVLADLRKGGYEFEEKDIRNYWPEHQLYKGINTTLRLKGGIDVFELQFHTEESWRAKKEAHPLYEESRLQTTSPERREELERRMIEVFGRIRTPPGVDDIGRVVKK
jgi:hypothetical protein